MVWSREKKKIYRFLRLWQNRNVISLNGFQIFIQPIKHIENMVPNTRADKKLIGFLTLWLNPNVIGLNELQIRIQPKKHFLSHRAEKNIRYLRLRQNLNMIGLKRLRLEIILLKKHRELVVIPKADKKYCVFEVMATPWADKVKWLQERSHKHLGKKVWFLDQQNNGISTL